MEENKFNPVEYANRLTQLLKKDSITNMAYSGPGKAIVSEAKIEKPEVYRSVDTNIVRLLQHLGPGTSPTQYDKFNTLYELAKEQTDVVIPSMKEAQEDLEKQKEKVREALIAKMQEIEEVQKVVIKLFEERKNQEESLRGLIQKQKNSTKVLTAIKKIKKQEQTDAKNALKELNQRIKELQENLNSEKAAKDLLMSETLDQKGSKQLTDLIKKIKDIENSLKEHKKQAKEMKTKLPDILKPTEEKGLIAWLRS